MARESSAPLRLVEFASGYGMVSRHLPSALPNTAILSIDIDPEAVAFCGAACNVATRLSHTVPEQLVIPRADVVFALSFFSHIPANTFGRWLDTLYAAVEPGGYLILTRHGRKSIEVTASAKASCRNTRAELLLQLS